MVPARCIEALLRTVQLAFFALRVLAVMELEQFQILRANVQNVGAKEGITIAQLHTALVAYFAPNVILVAKRDGSEPIFRRYF